MFKSKKFRKLIRDPELYFSDWALKLYPKNKFLNENIRKSTLVTITENKYSVISAVYGVEKYLDDYFNSLVNQSIGFVRNIELIMVDDGSLDGSAEIIKKWQKLYPNNIKYVKKENGGQASARNLGLEYATGNWVTYIDPDDFVDEDYFFEVDAVVKANNVSLVACNFIYYYENDKSISDTHPLAFKFQDNGVQIKNLGRNIQLSMSSAFFRKALISKFNLKISTKIKPNFEDGHFLNTYLLHLEDEDLVFFSKKAKYLYRKREDSSSTIDKSVIDPRRYTDVLRYGYLDLLQKSLDLKKEVPLFLQNLIMYDLMWLIRDIVNNGHRYYFLEESQKEDFLNLCREIFSYVEEKNILAFNLARSWFYHKIGILNLFKNTAPSFNIFYIDSVDEKRGLLLIRYFSSSDDFYSQFYESNKALNPLFLKKTNHELFKENFIYEYNFYLKVNPKEKYLFFYSELEDTRLSFKGKQYRNKIEMSTIFKESYENSRVNGNYVDSWIFMDRDIGADDNAEHLYRYIKNNTEKKNCYFILRRESNDWARLENEGFKLIEFASTEHEAALLACSKLISSHADYYIFEPFETKSIKSFCDYHFVFLQHGVIKDNLSNWLNSKNIDLFITSTIDEYASIVTDKFNYKFTEFNVRRTGLPRYDNLFLKSQIEFEKKEILIMPTWRQTIVGNTVAKGNERQYSNDFFDTDYYLMWNDFLQSHFLRELKERFTIKFFPHVNVQIYLRNWDIPDFIKIEKNSNGKDSFQDSLLQGGVLITDYSSVAFDFSYLRKPVIYYQFDRKDIESGSHIYQKGYFDYELDGFGPVVENLENLIIELKKTVESDFFLDTIYLDRINNTFSFDDGLCCYNVYKAIRDLDKKLDSNIYNITRENIVSQLELAERKKLYIEYIRLAEFYFNTYSLDDEFSNQLLEKYTQYILKINKPNKIYEVIDIINEKGLFSDFSGLMFRLLTQLEDWSFILKYYNFLSDDSKKDKNVILAYKKAKKAFSEIDHDYDNLVKLHSYYRLINDDPNFYIPVIADLYYKVGAIFEADMFLEQRSNQLSETIGYREFAHLRFYQGYYNKSLWHFKKMFEEMDLYQAPRKSLCFYFLANYFERENPIEKSKDIFDTYWFNNYLVNFLQGFESPDEDLYLYLIRKNNILGFYDISHSIIINNDLIPKDKEEIVLFTKVFHEIGDDYEDRVSYWNQSLLMSSLFTD